MNDLSAAALITDLKTILPASQVRADADSRTVYGQDWTRLFTPNPAAVVFPTTVPQIQRLVEYANARHIALVPSGGRTGLSGGAVACHGEVVVSFERMSRMLAFDPIERSVTCEPGLITENLQQYAREQGLYYPIDFAARGSSQIGGNIATNAGGIKVIRYGLTRDWVTGIKVVTGKGELLDLNKGLIKNASGYDLRHLFIGSEGTLGFIVEATLKLTRPPGPANVILFGVPALASVMAIFTAFRNALELNAFEFFSQPALTHVIAKGLTRPFETEAPYYLLIEFEHASAHDQETALEVFEYCANQGWLTDGVISQSQTQARELWRLREDITESISSYLPYKNDVSVRISRVPEFLTDIDELLRREYPDFQVIWFGHIGDGNLHLSVLKPPGLDQSAFLEKCQTVNQRLFSVLRRHGGSISAEHGVGLVKKPYLEYTRDPVEVTCMRAIKQVFDPNHIMNPGKIFD